MAKDCPEQQQHDAAERVTPVAESSGQKDGRKRRILYSCTVFVSVRLLYHENHRLSTFAIKIQVPAVGWLVLDCRESSSQLVARLVDHENADLLPWLETARVTASGRRGMLVRGVQYRKKGRKHSHVDQQAWWCQAPPRAEPIIDRAERLRAAEEICRKQADAGWGND